MDGIKRQADTPYFVMKKRSCGLEKKSAKKAEKRLDFPSWLGYNSKAVASGDAEAASKGTKANGKKRK